MFRANTTTTIDTLTGLFCVFARPITCTGNLNLSAVNLMMEQVSMVSIEKSVIMVIN